MKPSVVSWEKVRELCREDGILGTLKLGCRYAYGCARLWYLRRVKRATEVICRIHDYRMITPANGLGLPNELITVGNHEKFATRELQKRLGRGWHVIDLGANIGYYALMEAMRVGSSGKVYAIEPVPDNYDLLLRNIKLNGLESIVQGCRLAIGEKRGNVPMTISRFMNRHTFLGLEPEATVGLLDVPMVTFRDFVKEHGVDLAKLALIRMDIEGYEAEVLPGIVEVLRGRTNVNLQIEFHPRQIDSAPGCSFRDTLILLNSVTDRFEWLLVRDGHRKIILRNIPIEDVLASEKLMKQANMETWLTLRGQQQRQSVSGGVGWPCKTC